MRRDVIPLLAIPFLILLGIPAGIHGDSSTLPPRIIQLTREYILPGKSAAYEDVEASAAKMCAQTGCPTSYLGLKSMTGPNQVWLMRWFDTYAALEAASADYAQNSSLMNALNSVSEQKAALVSHSETLLAEYRPALSYGSSASLPASHYFWVGIVTVLPGHGQDFEAFLKLEKVADERARAGETCYVYHVTSGQTGNIYLLINVMRSLQEADNVAQLRDGEHGLTEAPKDEGARLLSASVSTSENYLFAADPAISYLPKNWISADPDFWAAAAVKQ